MMSQKSDCLIIFLPPLLPLSRLTTFGAHSWAMVLTSFGVLLLQMRPQFATGATGKLICDMAWYCKTERETICEQTRTVGVRLPLALHWDRDGSGEYLSSLGHAWNDTRMLRTRFDNHTQSGTYIHKVIPSCYTFYSGVSTRIFLQQQFQSYFAVSSPSRFRPFPCSLGGDLRSAKVNSWDCKGTLCPVARMPSLVSTKPILLADIWK